MSSRDETASILRRVDVRLALGLAASIGLLLVGLVSVFFLVATHETVELLEESLDLELASAAARGPLAAPAGPEHPVAVRRVEPGGEIHLLQGQWPAAGAFLPDGTSNLRLAFADPSAYFLMERSLADGASLQATTSLAAFVGERREQLDQILVSLALSLAGLLVVTLVATRLALAPLRSATLAVERVDEHHLDRRIPVRGAGDDLDRHARALNRVLARLEEAFQRMTHFSADVAHELRTPVNRMLNLADLALLRDGEGSSAPDLIALREAAEGMRRLIDDLLLLSRGDWGYLAARRERVALEPLLGGLASLFGPTFEERKISLRVREDTAGVVALGDRELLQRAVANLLDNALRHAPTGGEVELASGRDGALAFLEVSDSGSGIPEADRRRVFDRFVQLDEARAGEGAGLGLALVRMIAHLQGGEVSVGKADLGGARFRITLPAASPQKQGPGSAAVLRCCLPILATLLGVVAIEVGLDAPARSAEMPRLILLMVVDQLPASRLDADLPGGLGRLAREGRLYTEATLDHAITETCPGHATILTGRHPSQVGIPENRFLDLEQGKAVYCVADSAASARVLGGAEGRSPRNLRASTLGDWMKSADPASRVFSVSGKDRAAITLAGHSPDAAYWFQDVGEIGFTTSAYYLDRLPQWVRDWNGHTPPQDGFLSRIPARWDHLSDQAGAPQRPDDFPGESRRFGRTSGHPLRDEDLEEFAARLEASPYLDEATVDFATALVREEGLGRGSSPDLLAISFSAMDYVGHLYGPYSHESQDTLRRLDLAVGHFLDFLELELGPAAVLAALTSDHGVLPLPEWLERTGESRCPVKGGRTDLEHLGLRLLAKLHWEFSPLFSIPRPWLIFAGFQLGVDRSLARRHGVAVSEVVAATRRILEAEPAIARVWTPEEIENGEGEFARLYRNSFTRGRSGDLVVQIAPTCLISPFDEGTTHGSPYLYDRAIPLIFWGAGIEAGRVPGPARTVDIAPTLARRLGVTPPSDLDGRPLFD